MLSWDGEEVSLDLGEMNAKQVGEYMAELIRVGTRTRPPKPAPKPGAGPRKTPERGPDAYKARLRAWADAHHVQSRVHPELPAYLSPGGNFQYPAWLTAQFDAWEAEQEPAPPAEPTPTQQPPSTPTPSPEPTPPSSPEPSPTASPSPSPR